MEVKKRVEIIKDFLLNVDNAEQRLTAIKKLDALPVTLNVLQETGIGKAVNQLRHDPKIGIYAKRLVRKWKEIAIKSAVENDYAVQADKKSSTQEKTKAKISQQQTNATVGALQLLDDSSPCCSRDGSKDEESASKDFLKRRKHSVGLTNANGTFEEALSKVDSITTTIKAKRTRNDEAEMVSNQLAARRNAILKSLSNSLQQQPVSSKQPTALPSVNSGKTALRQPVAGTSSDYLQDVLSKRKHQRAHVYAGRKTTVTAKVSPLFDICIRLLCDNIDALGYTGGIPTDILQPILLRATPAQLYSIESYNPYLIEDTDDIWKKHCNREFVGAKPDAETTETWRQLYQRLVEERNQRLLDVTATIAAAQAMQEPKRTAKLADAKTPPEVLRKQLKYGTGVPITGVHEVLQSKRDRDAGITDKRQLLCRIASDDDVGMRARGDRTQTKVTKAPLMAKALKMMKQCRRY